MREARVAFYELSSARHAEHANQDSFTEEAFSSVGASRAPCHKAGAAGLFVIAATSLLAAFCLAAGPIGADRAEFRSSPLLRLLPWVPFGGGSGLSTLSTECEDEANTPRHIKWTNHPNMCLSVPAGEARNGVLFQLAVCDSGSPSTQQFLFRSQGGRIQLASNPKLCLDVRSHFNFNGNIVQLWDCNDRDSDQVFFFSSSAAGSKIHWSSHRGKCVDVKDHQAAPGTQIQIWECISEDSDQHFSALESTCTLPVATSPTSQALVGRQIRWSNHPNMCIGMSEGGTQNGGSVELATCRADEGVQHQLFAFGRRGKVKLASNPGLCLGVSRHGDFNGNTVQLVGCIDGDADQDFLHDGSPDGRIRWASHADKCVDVKDHLAVDGTAIQIWQCIVADSDQHFLAEEGFQKTITTTTTTLVVVEGITVLESKPGAYWKQKQAYRESQVGNGEPIIDVDLTSLDQTIIGFGGALTEASAVVLSELRSEMQQEVIDAYYGESGLEYTLGRVHINSCDLSTSSYSFDDVKDDYALSHFDMEVTRNTFALIPLIKRVRERVEKAGKELKLLASPWSPPAWMKSNQQMVHSGFPGLRPECRDVWARYIAKWLTAYKAQGINIWAMTIQNEPMANTPWEACIYSPEYEADFLANYLGPIIKSQHPEVAIFAFDHNKGDMVKYVKTVTQNAEAAKFLSGVAFHWYGGDHFEAVQEIHNSFPHYIMLPSEATYERYRMPSYLHGSLQGPGAPPFGLGYAHDIIGNLNSGGAGWIDWNILLDTTGGPNHMGNTCDAAIIADTKAQTLWKHPQYYYIGHFSKFLIPGSRVAKTTVTGSWKYTQSIGRPYGTCTGADGLEAVSALRPDGQIVVVVLNCAGQEKTFQLRINSQSIAPKAVIPGQGIQTYLIAAKTA